MAVELGDVNDIDCNIKDKVHAREIDSLPSTMRCSVCHYSSLISASHLKRDLVCFLLLWRDGNRKCAGNCTRDVGLFGDYNNKRHHRIRLTIVADCSWLLYEVFPKLLALYSNFGHTIKLL